MASREGRGVRRRTASRQSRQHHRCTTTAAAEAEAAIAAAATDAEKAPVWEWAKPVAFGAACEGLWGDRLGLLQGAPVHISSALDCTTSSSSAA